MRTLKKLGLFSLVLVAIVLTEALALMLLTGQLFNSLALPIIDNADFTWLLIKNNPLHGMLELVRQPLLIIGHEQSFSKDYTAALYFYPVGTLLHCLLAAWISRFISNKTRSGIKGLVVALLLIMLSLPSIWLASCCGDTPGWPVDTALRQYVFAVGGDPLARLEFYESILPALFPIQLLIGATGFGLLYRRISG